MTAATSSIIRRRWKPRIDFAGGLRQTVDWYAAHRDWWEPKRAALAGQLDERAWSTARL